MGRYSQMSKIGPRCVALSSHWGPLVALGVLNVGAPICRQMPTTSTAYSRNVRHMSASTRGASPRSGKKPAVEEDEEEDRYLRPREYIRVHTCKSSSSSSSSENVSANANQTQRENYNEKQSDTHVDFQRVKEPPPPSNQQWWYPDPFTGHYVPRDNYGEISMSVVLKEEKVVLREQVLDVEKAPLKKSPAPSPVFTKLSGVPSKGEKGGWWTSMEELPDLDHFSMRC